MPSAQILKLIFMKTLKIFSTIIICICLTSASFAQKAKKESFKVAGECGMCKNKIEKAAKEAGAKYAAWDVETKVLTVKYNSTSTNTAKIQKAIAGTGYDTPEYKATTESYNNLHACCKYDRDSVKACCDNEKCGKGDDCCAAMDCCNDKECCKTDGSAKMDCCKEGKCSKEGHDGKACCKQL